jgi:L-aminopeptidase/D-esterase-like protein
MRRTGVNLVQIVYLSAFLFAEVCEAEYSVTLTRKLIDTASFDGSITKISGILVGHSSKAERPTGCTVILCSTTCVGGVDIRGSAPGTRETDLLDPINAVNIVNAIVLSGGSAFGLDTASGVVRCLAEKNMGFPTRDRPVPIVPAAVLYDLSVGNDSFIVPDANSGYSACMTANNSPVIEGNVGAGSGASIGKLFGMRHAMKTGLGSAALTVRDLMTNVTITVGAIVALNAVGDVYKNGTLIAGARTMDGKHLLNTVKNLLSIGSSTANTSLLGVATTLACVVTDAKLTKAQAKKVSQMAHDGFARAINPVHTMFDGDIVFTLATGVYPISDVSLIGLMAAETVERAIIRAVEQATGLPDLPSIHELSSTGQNLVFNITLFMFSLISNCLLRK